MGISRGEEKNKEQEKSNQDTLPSVSFYSTVALQLAAHIIQSMQKTEWKEGGKTKKGKTENMKRDGGEKGWQERNETTSELDKAWSTYEPSPDTCPTYYSSRLILFHFPSQPGPGLLTSFWFSGHPCFLLISSSGPTDSPCVDPILPLSLHPE